MWIRTTLACLIAASLGYLLGALSGSRRIDSREHPASNQLSRPVAPASTGSAATHDPESNEAQPSPATSLGTPEERSKLRSDIYRLLLKSMQDEYSVGESIGAWTKLGLLGEGDAEHFISIYRAKIATGEIDKAALQLSFVCGGTKVREFLLERLAATPNNTPEGAFIRKCVGDNLFMFSMRRIPANDDIGNCALRLISSADPVDRRCAATLMGGLVSDDMYREFLRRIVSNDADLKAKASAVRSLARSETQADAVFIQDVMQKHQTATSLPGYYELMNSCRRALAELKETTK